MDIQKEREAFEAWFSQEFRCDEWEYNPFSRMEFNGIDAYSCSTVNTTWSAWQAAKDASHNQAALYQSEINHLAQANQQWREKAAQAIPDGFVLVAKEPTPKMIAHITNTPIEVNLLCDHADVFLSEDEACIAYKAVIEAQEQK